MIELFFFSYVEIGKLLRPMNHLRIAYVRRSRERNNYTASEILGTKLFRIFLEDLPPLWLWFKDESSVILVHISSQTLRRQWDLHLKFHFSMMMMIVNYVSWTFQKRQKETQCIRWIIIKHSVPLTFFPGILIISWTFDSSFTPLANAAILTEGRPTAGDTSPYWF